MSKKFYHVAMPVHGTWSCYVEADSQEEAIQFANHIAEGSSANLCWSCDALVSEATIGEAVDPNSATEMLSDDGIKQAQEWIEANSCP